MKIDSPFEDVKIGPRQLSSEKVADSAPKDSDSLTALIRSSEDWLVHRMFSYNTSRGYDKYSSTLEEAWRLSIQVLSALLVKDATERGGVPAEFSPEDNYGNDPVASFGIMEAQRHRERGIDLGMFLSLLKYYRQAYLDLITQQNPAFQDASNLRQLIIRFFDRIEIGISVEWNSSGKDHLLEELRSTNRFLTNEKNKYLTLVESLSDPVLLLDSRNRIDNINRAAATLLGRSRVPGSEYYCLSRDRVLEFSENGSESPRSGGCLQDEPLEKLLPWLQPACEAFKNNRQSVTGTLIETVIENRTRWFEAMFTPMPDISGKFSGTTLVLRDITEKKGAEVEREKLQEQLLQSRKLESIGRLAGGVAHDFNNMLGVIIGHSEMALEQTDPEQPIHEDLQEILAAAKRSADLTRQLLAFARKQTVSPRVLDLNDTIEGMFKMLRRLIGEAVRLTWLPGRDLWPVKIDPIQVHQILADLCINARDAIDTLGEITIKTENVTLGEGCFAGHDGFTPGDFVLLAVSDDGCGMDEKTLEKLFEPFFTTKAMGKGTGLGLATIYGIVTQNSGFLNAFSEPGRGTTFKIHLPRHIGKTGDGRIKNRMKADGGGMEMILLVEDEPGILKIGTKMLETLGYRVLAANSPKEAIRLAERYENGIHLLISDVVMPDMNGRDLAERLRSRRPNLKWLFMSGYTADIIARHGILEEGIHFIQKPFSRGELAAKLKEILEHQIAT